MSNPNEVKTFVVLRCLACMLLAFAVLPLPYGYYSFLRVSITAVSGYGVYLTHKWRKTTWQFLFIFLILLFNPLFKVSLSKLVWQVIDIASAGLFLVSLFAMRQDKNL